MTARDRYDQCNATCTTDCGACKGAGKPATAAERLAEIEARANAATEGPWITTHGPGEQAQVWGAEETDVEPVAAVRGFHDPADSVPDAEFIAHSREDVPALVAALRAVLEEHACSEWEDGLGNPEHECRVCRDEFSEPAAYPCPTVQAIDAALGGAR